MFPIPLFHHPLVTTNLSRGASPHHGMSYLDIGYKWNQIIFDLLWLDNWLLSHRMSSGFIHVVAQISVSLFFFFFVFLFWGLNGEGFVHSKQVLYHWATSPSPQRFNNIPLYGWIPFCLYIHPWMDISVLSVLNNALNIHVQVFEWTYISIFLGAIFRSYGILVCFLLL
jgi:hypothetical protein